MMIVTKGLELYEKYYGEHDDFGPIDNIVASWPTRKHQPERVVHEVDEGELSGHEIRKLKACMAKLQTNDTSKQEFKICVFQIAMVLGRKCA